MICFRFIVCLVIFIIIPQNVQSLFLQPVLEIINSTGSISCTLSGTETNYEDYDLCAIRVYTYGTAEDPQTATVLNGIWFTNTFRVFIKTRNCNGFSAVTDIGTGECDVMPYETATSMTLCICATNYCNTDLVACQASVDRNLEVPQLPTIMTSLRDTVQCAEESDSFSSFSLNDDGLSIIDNSERRDYFQTHSVLCTIIAGASLGVVQRRALIEENYQSYLTNRLHELKMLRQRVPTDTPIQTDTNIYVKYTSDLGSFEECGCTQSSACNNNINTCAPNVIQVETTISTQSVSNFTTDLTTISTTNGVTVTDESTVSVTTTQSSVIPTVLTTDSTSTATSAIITDINNTTSIATDSTSISSATTSLTNTNAITSEVTTTVSTTTGITTDSTAQNSVSTLSGLSTSAIVGIVVGGILGAGIVISLIAYACYSFTQQHSPSNRGSHYRI